MIGHQSERKEGDALPHYRCVACSVRLEVPGGPAELVGDLCPECGSLLEPVTELAELIGFRSITSVAAAAAPVRSASHERIADTVDGFLTRRAAALERARVEEESWLDDDEPPYGTAVACRLPLPGTNPF